MELNWIETEQTADAKVGIFEIETFLIQRGTWAWSVNVRTSQSGVIVLERDLGLSKDDAKRAAVEALTGILKRSLLELGEPKCDCGRPLGRALCSVCDNDD